VANSLAPTENVRAALLLVSRGETPYGIVYRTDAAAEPRVKIVGTFPADSHPPIIYPAVLIATSKNPEAAKYLAFIESTKAKLAFEKQGFTVLP
jgi:molybdate transport system substrate-binding protein